MQTPKRAPLLQLIQNVVLKCRDERRRGLVVQLFKESVPVSCGAKDIALPGLKGLLAVSCTGRFLGVLLIFRAFITVFIVIGHQGSRGIDAIVAELPLVPAQFALEAVRGVVLRGLDGRAAIDRVGQGPDDLGVAAKTDGADDPSFFIVVQDDGIRVSRQPRLRFRVIVAEFNESAFCHSRSISPFQGQKKTVTAHVEQLQSFLSFLILPGRVSPAAPAGGAPRCRRQCRRPVRMGALRPSVSPVLPNLLRPNLTPP